MERIDSLKQAPYLQTVGAFLLDATPHPDSQGCYRAVVIITRHGDASVLASLTPDVAAFENAEEAVDLAFRIGRKWVDVNSLDQESSSTG
jgi:hypothetical protein